MYYANSFLIQLLPNKAKKVRYAPHYLPQASAWGFYLFWIEDQFGENDYIGYAESN